MITRNISTSFCRLAVPVWLSLAILPVHARQGHTAYPQEEISMRSQPAKAVDTPTEPPRLKPHTDPSFLLTGKLFGYFRSPSRQTESDGADPQHPCPAAETIEFDKTIMSPDAAEFVRVIKDRSQSILLGTGDNFSPNYYSRVMVSDALNLHKEEQEWDAYQNPPHWVKYNEVSDKLWGYLRTGLGTVPTDNVACFLSYVGYKAIVPGKHDFFYGPERLRQLARFLAGMPETYSHYHPVQILASNLVIETTWATDHKPVADSMKGPPSLPFDTQYGRSDSRQKVEVEDFTDGGFAYPSLRRIKLKFTGWNKDDTVTVKVFLCKATKTGDPDSLPITGPDVTCPTVTFLKSSPNPPTAETVFPSRASQETENEYRLPISKDLEQNQNYGICLENPDSPRASRGPFFYCFRFAVFRPFFQFPDSPIPQDHSIVHFQNPEEYVVATLPDGMKAAIFGVVDPSLTASIGNLNYSWKNLRIKNTGTTEEEVLDKAELKYKTAISIGDPVTALKEIQQKFEEKNPDFHGVRVLLAQMSPTKAQLLAAQFTGSLRFDLVVSAADDTAATPNGKIKVTPALELGGENPVNATALQPPSVVFVPPTHQASRNHATHRWVNVRELYLTTDHTHRWTYQVAGAPAMVSLPHYEEDPTPAFWLAVCNQLYLDQPRHRCNRVGDKITDTAPDQNPRDWDEKAQKDALQQLVLLRMQKRVNADVAMLQQRDFYLDGLEEFYVDHCQRTAEKCFSPEFPAQKFPMQEVLDRIIWKGDFVFHLSVQGSTLKTILDESKTYSKLEKSPVTAVDERGRSLVTAGVHYDQGRDEYRINSAPLDPTRLYTLVTSDYVALGDTGYPELGKPPVGDPPDPISQEQSLTRIATSLCRSFSSDASFPTSGCDHHVTDYFDDFAHVTPNDTRPGDTQWHKLFVWTFLRGRLGQPSDWERDRNYSRQDVASGIDKRIQTRETGVVSLDKLSIGFDGLSHNLSESTLKNEFGGIPNAQVTAKHFHSWDTDIESSAKRFQKRFDLFVSENLQYAAKFTSQATPPRDVNQTTNLIQIDFGTYLHAYESPLPRLQWLVGGHFETQPFQPFSTITINPVGSITSPQNLLFNPNRSRLTLARTGPRWQNRKSFFEVGGEAGANFHAIRQFDIKTSSSGTLVTQCPLEAQQTLSKCVNNYNTANPTIPITQSFFVQTENETRDRFGIYWNSSLVIPLDPRITIQIDNQGDYFFPVANDNSTDTRFRHQYTQAVKFYVFPNLDFEPTYKIFLFENKVQNHFLFQQELAIKINLAFDLWNWHEKKQEVQYKKPSPQQ
jgi:hypothetical protein